MKIIEKKAALKAFYYFMAIDGKITEDEKDKFIQIGNEIDEDKFIEYYEELICECDAKLSEMDEGDEFYDVVQECLDGEILNVTEDVECGVCSRLLIWDMLAVAHSDDDFSQDEKRLIAHVARKTNVEKSILLELQQAFSTISDMEKKLEKCEVSMEPYCLVRPIVDEIEHRRDVLMNSVRETIADELIVYPDIIDTKNQGESFISSATGFISSAAGTVADGVVSGFNRLSGLFGKKVTESENEIEECEEKLKIETAEEEK